MSWHLYFRIQIVVVNGNTPIVHLGYPPATVAGGALSVNTTFKSLSGAISKGLAFNRRFQSSGLDTYLMIFGKVLDVQATPIVGLEADTEVAPATPVRALTTDELAEQTFGRLDTPDTELKRAISLANSAPGGTGAAIVTDLPQDVLTP